MKRTIEMKRIIFFLVIIGLLSSCKDSLLDKDFQGDDWFYLENNGAVMPVWVKGNKQSKVFILLLHGGPGDSDMYYDTHEAFIKLRNDYAVVYWDQRMSGASQGNAKPESMNVEQFVDDLGKVIALIRYKYDNPILFLLGHSWGGALGTAFLINPINQTFISGWIELDGGHNYENGFLYSIEWVRAKAEDQIALGKDVDYWRKEIEWYNSVSLTNANNVQRHTGNVDKLNGYYYDPSNNFGIQFSWLFNSPYSASALLNANYLIKYIDKPENWTLNYTPEMNNIKIPSLILWGRHDGVFPVALAQEAYDNIGADNKHLYIFEKSAHNACFEEPDMFVERVKLFINEYK
jgi:pimeloyl-ACP methyl ester carboxylesterase